MNISPDYFFLIVGFVLIILEVAILTGATGGWLIFIGVGALATGFLGVAGLFTGWAAALSIFVGLSVLSTLLLWKMFKSMPKEKADELNMIGDVVEVTEDITKDKAGKVTWSGVAWQAEIDSTAEKQEFKAGEKVMIASTKNISVYVKETS